MLTLDEAAAVVAMDVSVWERHRDILDEAIKNPMVLQSLMSVRDLDGSENFRLIVALRIGVVLGIEMEKGER